jgi:hypothetical protein
MRILTKRGILMPIVLATTLVGPLTVIAWAR